MHERLVAGLLALFLICQGLVWGQLPEVQRKAWAGDPIAMMSASEAFRFGTGLAKNEDSADHYIKKAAEKGLPDAQYLLGTKYLIEIFSPTNYAKGLALVRKAADQGHADAQWRLCQIYSVNGTMNESDNYYNPAKAYTYGEKAAASGNPVAMLYCAEARLKGFGTTKNDSVAVELIKASAIAKNYVPAQIRLGDMYWEGKVTGKCEPLEALHWYEKVIWTPYANIEQKGQADFGAFQVDQLLKRSQNTFLNAAPILPQGMFHYKMRQ